MNRPLDQQPVLPDQEDAEEIDVLLDGSNWHREPEWRIEYVIAEGEHDTARLYGHARISFGVGDREGYAGYSLVDQDSPEAFRESNLTIAVNHRARIIMIAEALGAKVSPLIRSRRVCAIASEYVTEH